MTDGEFQYQLLTTLVNMEKELVRLSDTMEDIATSLSGPEAIGHVLNAVVEAVDRMGR